MATYSALTLVSNALTNLGILESGGVVNASDGAEGLRLLNYMIGQWRINERYIWQKQTQTLSPLTANVGVYPIGPTGAAPFNVARPTFIEQSYITFVGPGAHQITSPLDPLTAKEYNDLADLSATAEIPQMLYYDRQSPNGILNFYPIPRCTVVTGVVLVTWVQISNFANLAATAELPDGYAEALSNALAVRMMPMFGVAIQPQVATLTSELAKQAEETITELNAKVMGLINKTEVAEGN